jgi:hypothetical protein
VKNLGLVRNLYPGEESGLGEKSLSGRRIWGGLDIFIWVKNLGLVRNLYLGEEFGLGEKSLSRRRI